MNCQPICSCVVNRLFDNLVVPPMGKRLRLFVIRDCVTLAALISFFYLPDPYGPIILLIVLAGIARVQKAICDTPEFQPREKHVYVALSAGWIAILLVLLAHWARQHANNSRVLAVASAAAITLLLIFLMTVKQLYRSWPPSWLKSERSKLTFVVGSVTLLALACQWLFYLGAHTTSVSYSPILNLLPPFLVLGLMYVVVLRQRKQLFPNVPASRIAMIMFAFACLFVAVVSSVLR
jgi:hypothetical protein